MAISMAVVGCSDPCENNTVAKVASPSGRFSAVVFSRNCGATTGFNTQLSIVPADDAPGEETGSAFIADGTVPLKLEWISDTELAVSGTQGSKNFKQERHVRGVLISYR
ncbi:hypothetical protein J2X20_002974 [Pelomonas saccharophila]|uniref:Lipoprotein n=1 Tax=Roseateles saccharophilus TaxID=304 RepID=A0ABU1YN81_ROSSA|nr:hypothetical protein [Roseateles saccharophilus]MDR7270316.1 hypothetical protein [Roseateles saccharophilus]